MLKFGLDTFGDITHDADGAPDSGGRTIRNVLAQARLADEVGLHSFGVGEHHRPEYAISSPVTMLAGIAAMTSRIRLRTAVVVLSSTDPVRLLEAFTTVDAISGGRAELGVGRGSFTESFPLFGFDLADYETLFEERLALFDALRRGGPVDWSGRTRAPLMNAHVYPQPERDLPVWVGVGGSPESVVRAARYGFGLTLAIIGGPAVRFLPFVQQFRRSLGEFGMPEAPVAVHSPGHIADTDEEAFAALFPALEVDRNAIGVDRGWAPYNRLQFQRDLGPEGALYAGSPERVAQKIAATVRTLGIDQFNLKYAHGPLGHDAMMRSIELYGTRVVPRVRELLETGEREA